MKTLLLCPTIIFAVIWDDTFQFLVRTHFKVDRSQTIPEQLWKRHQFMTRWRWVRPRSPVTANHPFRWGRFFQHLRHVGDQREDSNFTFTEPIVGHYINDCEDGTQTLTSPTSKSTGLEYPPVVVSEVWEHEWIAVSGKWREKRLISVDGARFLEIMGVKKI